jgi:hypothetical protein
MTTTYRVVYPKGDRSKLTVAQGVDYEVSDWDIASRHEYQDEEDAWLQAEFLAGHFNKEVVGRDLPAYLD